jgi:hypothetical protein
MANPQSNIVSLGSAEQERRRDAQHEKFEQVYYAYKMAEAATFSPHLNLDEVESNEALERADEKVWDVIKTEAANTDQIVRKVEILEKWLLGGSPWLDGREHSMIFSIKRDLYDPAP